VRIVCVLYFYMCAMEMGGESKRRKGVGVPNVPFLAASEAGA
jgi:hypothetical protein